MNVRTYVAIQWKGEGEWIGKRRRLGQGKIVRGGAGLPCWSATEQSFSINLYTEVTNKALPQIQAKSDWAQPVAEMPESTAFS